jgi:hypothetical protein
LLSAEIPSTFYIFTAALQNTTLFVGLSASQPTPLPVMIEDGNYDKESMVVALTDALQTAFPGKTFIVAIDDTTFRLKVQCMQGEDIILDTTQADPLQPTGWGLAYYLGFLPGQVITMSTLTSSNVVNLNPYTYLLLDIKELSRVDEGGLFGTGIGNRCFTKIPINGVSFDTIFRDVNTCAPDFVRMYPSIGKLDKLSISLRFHDGNHVHFNGAEHSLWLELETDEAPPLLLSTRQQQVPEEEEEQLQQIEGDQQHLEVKKRTRIPKSESLTDKKPRQWKVYIIALVTALLFGLGYYSM